MAVACRHRRTSEVPGKGVFTVIVGSADFPPDINGEIMDVSSELRHASLERAGRLGQWFAQKTT